MLEQGVWAEVIVGDEHLRLYSEQTPSGVQSSVYNVRNRSSLHPRRWMTSNKGRIVRRDTLLLICGASQALKSLH